MKKIVLACIASFVLVGCANYEITGMMCDQVRSDPHATIPSECRRYSETLAQEATRAEEEILSPDDAIKFTK